MYFFFSKTCQIISVELLDQGGLNSSKNVKFLSGLGKETKHSTSLHSIQLFSEPPCGVQISNPFPKEQK